MENYASFSGLGKSLAGVLAALGEDLSEEPAWTLKNTSGKVNLQIVWTKSKIPATTKVTRQENPPVRRATLPKSPSDSEQLDSKTHAKSSATGSKRTRKSPSTLRRDRQRREKWIQKRISTSKPVSTSSSEYQTTTVSKPTGDVSAVKLPTVSDMTELCTPPAPQDAAGHTSFETPQRKTPVLQVPSKEYPHKHDQNEDHNSLSPQDVSSGPANVSNSEDMPGIIIMEYGKCDFPFCPKFDHPGVLKRRCIQCSTAEYCNNVCQTKHWPTHHRDECGKPF